jgi:hypothetical protein
MEVSSETNENCRYLADTGKYRPRFNNFLQLSESALGSPAGTVAFLLRRPWSAFGPKRTSQSAQLMSAFGGKADIATDG